MSEKPDDMDDKTWQQVQIQMSIYGSCATRRDEVDGKVNYTIISPIERFQENIPEEFETVFKKTMRKLLA